VSSARTDLCGRRSAMTVPTATSLGCRRLAFFILIPSFALKPESKPGALCVSSARTDLCGGPAALIVSIATHSR